MGSPRNEDLWAARDGGQKGLGGKGGQGSLSSPLLPPLRKAALEEAEADGPLGPAVEWQRRGGALSA